ncbi:MAG: BON domain-containing protein [Candidatus Mesenet longicola]|uniref:BON domain-containing protein n=1 Tax=Candidatus Mesenet longicola TaxID=1892558 RepID=A0A8J3HU44_9RICK|nr:MAG: BON domain-containing protein [Candidatus Mesenet longicola]GHM59069.1 MAG: BON domain-containing protein [Candidatus Mesenet longicola]
MKVIISLLLAVLIVIQSGCIPVLVGTAITTATVVSMQDKSLGSTIDDTTVMIRINKELLNNNLFSSIKVKVDEGRVLLIGSVDSIEKQIIAERVAWEQRGVKEVINKIKIKTLDNDSSITDIAKDSLITAKIKARILRRKNIKSVNYSVNTVDGVVYLMGIAQSSKELNEVIKIIREIKEVKDVVSYVRFIDK